MISKKNNERNPMENTSIEYIGPKKTKNWSAKSGNSYVFAKRGKGEKKTAIMPKEDALEAVRMASVFKPVDNDPELQEVWETAKSRLAETVKMVNADKEPGLVDNPQSPAPNYKLQELKNEILELRNKIEKLELIIKDHSKIFQELSK
jgi:hypothetical protein